MCHFYTDNGVLTDSQAPCCAGLGRILKKALKNLWCSPSRAAWDTRIPPGYAWIQDPEPHLNAACFECTPGEEADNASVIGLRLP